MLSSLEQSEWAGAVQAGAVQAVPVGSESLLQDWQRCSKPLSQSQILGRWKDRDAPGDEAESSEALRDQGPPPFSPSRLLSVSSQPGLRGVGKRPDRGPSGLVTGSLAVASGHSPASGLAVTLIDIVLHQSHHLLKLVLELGPSGSGVGLQGSHDLRGGGGSVVPCLRSWEGALTSDLIKVPTPPDKPKVRSSFLWAEMDKSWVGELTCGRYLLAYL